MNMAIIVLIVAACCTAVFLVVLYNRTVNLRHAAAELEQQIEDAHTESAEAQRRIFSLFGTDNVQRVAQERNLVKDTHPTYVSLSTLY
jgi:cell division protein FtsL